MVRVSLHDTHEFASYTRCGEASRYWTQARAIVLFLERLGRYTWWMYSVPL